MVLQPASGGDFMGALKLTTRFFVAALRWLLRHDRGAFQYEGFAASSWQPSTYG